MFRTLAVACIAVTIVSIGCDSKPTHDSLAKDMIGKMKEMVEVLKGVKDEASAKAAKPKLEGLKKEVDALKAEADKMPKPSAEDEKKLNEKYEPELEKLMGELAGEMIRIGSDPKLASELGNAMGS
jgi:peptidoglycan hydrolase CwlO-like protein